MKDQLVELLRAFAPAAWDTMVAWRDISVGVLCLVVIGCIYVASWAWDL